MKSQNEEIISEIETSLSQSHLLPPPPPPPLPSNFIDKSFYSQDLPEYLKDYPFDLPARIAHLAPKECFNETAFDVMTRFGPKSEFQISVELQIPSIIQFGPTCGIVAVQMLVNTSKSDIIPIINDLVLKARKHNYTTFGEMFNAQHLADFMQLEMNISSVVLYPFRSHLEVIIHHLIDSKPVLVPYDYSVNFTETGFHNGAKAHWAVLVGFCYNFDSILEPKVNIKNQTTEEIMSLIFQKKLFQLKNLYFYARHSKTNKICLWNSDDICKSNEQLKLVASKYATPETSFKIPPNGDIQKTLSGRFILIEKKFICQRLKHDLVDGLLNL